MGGLDDGAIGDRFCDGSVDLEVDVRPAAGVAGRKDRVEPGGAFAVGFRDPTQVVLVLDS